MLLDVRTAVLLAMLIAGLLAAVLAGSVGGYPAALRRPLRAWALALALQSMGWGLFGLRGAIDDLLSIPVANLLLVAAFVVTLRALRGFAGRAESHPTDALAVVFVGAVALVFLYVYPLLWLRVALISAVFAALFAACCRAVLQAGSSPRPRSQRVLAGLYAFLVVLMVARAARAVSDPTPGLDPLEPGLFQAGLFAVGALAPALATFGFMLMVNERLSAELTRRAALDPLTGAYNRRTLAELADRGIAQARRDGTGYGVLLLDVDHFKRINDTLGHAAGDDALQRLVCVLRDGMRAQDTLGRMGGEEFIVLLPGVSAAQARSAAERLRVEVEQARPVLAGTPWPMTVSIGVATWAGDADFESLLRRADAAMYEAKREGRNRIAVGDPVSRAPDAATAD